MGVEKQSRVRVTCDQCGEEIGTYRSLRWDSVNGPYLTLTEAPSVRLEPGAVIVRQGDIADDLVFCSVECLTSWCHPAIHPRILREWVNHG